MHKTISVKELIALSRFVFRTDFFDVKALCHIIRSQKEVGLDTSGSQPLSVKKQRLIVVVPRRIGSAPLRNRCRRRIKAFVRTMGLSILPCDLIFFVRESFAEISVQELRTMFIALQKRIKATD